MSTVTPLRAEQPVEEPPKASVAKNLAQQEQISERSVFVLAQGILGQDCGMIFHDCSFHSRGVCGLHSAIAAQILPLLAWSAFSFRGPVILSGNLADYHATKKAEPMMAWLSQFSQRP